MIKDKVHNKRLGSSEFVHEVRELSHNITSAWGRGGESTHADKMLTEGGRGVGP